MTEVFLISKRIRQRLQKAGKRFWAGDNISEFIHEGEKEMLINELTHQFQKVLEGLVIDVENDPNSNGTAKRLSKMYINELMSGRYDPMPPATAVLTAAPTICCTRASLLACFSNFFCLCFSW